MNNVWSDWVVGEPQESEVPVGEMLFIKTENHGLHYMPMWGYGDPFPIDCIAYKRQIKQKIQFKRARPNAIIPTRATDNSMGWDLYALHDGVIYPGKQELVNTGIQWACPKGWGGLITPRSGLAVKSEMDKRAGTIDGDYRDDIRVLLRNESDESFHYKAGDRIAQMVVVPYMGEAVEVDELDDTARGDGGFGSTGQ